MWNIAAGKREREIRLGTQTGIVFLPGAAQLATSRGADYTIWNLAPWHGESSLHRSDCPQPGVFATTTSNRDAVLSLNPQGLHLVTLPDGEVSAALRRPGQQPAYCVRFSPDQTKLLECNVGERCIGFWDYTAPTTTRVTGNSVDTAASVHHQRCRFTHGFDDQPTGDDVGSRRLAASFVHRQSGCSGCSATSRRIGTGACRGPRVVRRQDESAWAL